MRHANFAIVVLVCAAASTLSAQTAECKRASFVEKLQESDSLSRVLGNNVELHLLPMNDGSGWRVAVSPKTKTDEDWTYPVNYPLRTGEHQYFATGYGDTIGNKLRHTLDVRFVLNSHDFSHYSRLANETLKAQDNAVVSRNMAELAKARMGVVTITPLKSETTPDGQSVKWAELKIDVTTPKNFASSPELTWVSCHCPKPQ
jgi:hypothetical protein